MPTWIAQIPLGVARGRVFGTSPRGKRGVDMTRIKRLCFAASALAAVLIAGGASWRL
jgi:hypothetical protein